MAFPTTVKSVKQPCRNLALVLASTSRYRRELLSRLVLDFEVAPPGVDETAPARGNARRHGRAPRAGQGHGRGARAPRMRSSSAPTRWPNPAGLRLDKPGNRENAIRQLAMVSGRTAGFPHRRGRGRARRHRRCRPSSPRRSGFAALDAAQIERYVDREQPFDCAGSAKAEGLGIALIEAIEGEDPTALIGLPLIALTSLLALPRNPGALEWSRPATGRLYLVPMPLGADSDPRAVLPQATMEAAVRLRYFVAENARTARRVLVRLPLAVPIQQVNIEELNEHTRAESRARDCLPRCWRATTSAWCRRPAARPSRTPAPRWSLPPMPTTSPWCRWSGRASILLALMASGMNGQAFAFHGYLPVERRGPHSTAARTRERVGGQGRGPAVHRDTVSQRGAVRGGAVHREGRRRD